MICFFQGIIPAGDEEENVYSFQISWKTFWHLVEEHVPAYSQFHMAFGANIGSKILHECEYWLWSLSCMDPAAAESTRTSF